MGFILTSYMRVLNPYLVSSKAIIYVLLFLSMFQFCPHIRIILRFGYGFCLRYAKIFCDSVFIFVLSLSYTALSIIKSNWKHNKTVRSQCITFQLKYPALRHSSFIRVLIKSAIRVLRKQFKSLRPQVANLNVSD